MASQRSSAICIANLLNPTGDSQFTSMSIGALRTVPDLPPLQTDNPCPSDCTCTYNYSSPYSSTYSSPSISFSELTRHYPSSSAASMSDSGPPTAPWMQVAYRHTAEELEIAHILTHVGAGLYNSNSSAAQPMLMANAITERYPCPLAEKFHCDKNFSTSGHASRHSRTHTGIRKAVCPECGHRFSRRDNMQQHRSTHRSIGRQKFRSGNPEKDWRG